MCFHARLQRLLNDKAGQRKEAKRTHRFVVWTLMACLGELPSLSHSPSGKLQSSSKVCEQARFWGPAPTCRQDSGDLRPRGPWHRPLSGSEAWASLTLVLSRVYRASESGAPMIRLEDELWATWRYVLRRSSSTYCKSDTCNPLRPIRRYCCE